MDYITIGIIAVALGYTTFVILVCLLVTRSIFFLLFMIVNILTIGIFIIKKGPETLIVQKIGETMADLLKDIDVGAWYCEYRNWF